MKENLPLVSVIVPSYNHENYLKQRLESIFSQTYVNFEVILLDDCSTDGSQGILLEYAKNPKVSHCVFNAINSGNTFIQWNKGIELAKGDYIWIAESDDFCELNFLEAVSKPLIENKQVALSYSQSNRVDADGQITGSWKTHTDSIDASLFSDNFVLEGNLFIEKYLIYKNVIPNASAVIIRKQVLRNLGAINTDHELRYCGDWLLYFKIALNQKLAFCSKDLNNFRYHSKSVIATASRNETRIKILEVDFLMRSDMISFLKRQKVNNSVAILKNNISIINELQYEKGLLHIRNKEKLKGILVLFKIFRFFAKKFPLKNKLLLKNKKIFL
jgi:glycosyltransferase involved in cell wall biosynthesis